jgi:glycerol uptake facilitator-like aquaporin
LDAVKSHNPWLRLVAECVAELFGTTILVVFGCSGIAQHTLSRGLLASFLSVNFAFGFGALIAVYVAGPVSGAHLNPAVSIAMLSLRSITPLQCLTYMISRMYLKNNYTDIILLSLEFTGAFIAAALVFGTYYDAINKFDDGVRQVENI